MPKAKLSVIQLEENRRKLREYDKERKRFKRNDTKICREEQERAQQVATSGSERRREEQDRNGK